MLTLWAKLFTRPGGPTTEDRFTWVKPSICTTMADERFAHLEGSLPPATLPIRVMGKGKQEQVRKG